jgi:cytoskeletal protein RodZ
VTAPELESGGVATFGKWLARERELRALSRDEVARATKLGPAIIDALESGEEARMPPRAYVLGYLRAYAGVVGLDPDEVVLRFEEAAGVAPGDAAAPARRRPPPWLAAAVAGAIALAAAAVWLLLRG